MPMAENLLNRQLNTTAPNQASGVDVICLWAQESWGYLVVLINLYRVLTEQIGKSLRQCPADLREHPSTRRFRAPIGQDVLNSGVCRFRCPVHADMVPRNRSS